MKRLAPPLALGLPFVALLLFAGHAAAPTTSAQETLQLGAGVGSGTISGNVYTPSEVTIHTGDTIIWTVNSDEPHTVTFGDGPANVPPDEWPVALWTAPPPGGSPFDPVDLGTVSFDGTAHANTGIMGGGSTAGLTFTTEGDFTFICVIHPGMATTVHIDDAATATTQAEADAEAAAQEQAILGAVDPLRQDTLNNVVTSEVQPDGTTLWTVATSAQQIPGPPGGGTGYLDLLEFIPDEITIQEGDTIRWQNPGPLAFHTVTFLEPGTDPFALGDPFAVPVAKPSDTYDGQSLYNSGIFNFTADPPDSFELTFDQAGTFEYLCLLHFPLGQMGTVTVQEAPVPTATPPPALPATGIEGGGGTSASWLAIALGLLGGAVALTLAGAWAARRVVGGA